MDWSMTFWAFLSNGKWELLPTGKSIQVADKW
jgi:hypothetical protein